MNAFTCANFVLLSEKLDLDGCLPAFKKYRQAQDQYNTTLKAVSDRRKREAASIKGDPERQKVFDREQAAMQDTWRPVVNKLAELQRAKQ